MHRIVYVSDVGRKLSDGDLEQIVDTARRNNAKEGLTGVLIFYEDRFFQVLEGDEEAVRSVYESIEKDPRHDDMVKIIEEGIAERSFGDWSMGLMTATRKQIEDEVEGFNDFFQGGTCLTDVDSSRSRKLLQAFASGRWRVS